MIDSHALVGSCAQVGRRVHLSAGAMLGGVLEPVGALPVIVEDEALVGGNCGVYEGTIVGRRAVLGSGVILTGVRARSTTCPARPPTGAAPRVPCGSPKAPWSCRARGGSTIPSRRSTASPLYTPVIVKYRDEKTDAAAALEEALR